MLSQQLRLGAITLALGFSALAGFGRAPNFLFILSDDQRWDALSVVQRELGTQARFPFIQTPALDRIAAEGMRFRQAFVVNSLCSPSRASFLTGRYGHSTRVTNNHTAFPAGLPTIATALRARGYKTGFVGKWHMDDVTGGPRPDFDFSASFIGHGKYFDCPFDVGHQTVPTTGWVDDVSTQFAKDFLRQSHDQPFALVVGFKTPHAPWQPPERRAADYPDATIAPPAKTAPPPYAGRLRRINGKGEPIDKSKEKPLQLLDYFRAITAMDDCVGQLLTELDRLGLTENTVVVFASDNGYFHSEHDLGDKRAAYEESIRIPLLIRWPGKIPAGTVSDALTLNIDLAPTIRDLVGLPTDENAHGRSWRPLFADGRAPADWRQSFLYEYFYETRFAIPTMVGARTTAAKIVTYPGHPEWNELFDLSADPVEKVNLFHSPEAHLLRESMTAELERLKATTDYHVPPDVDPQAPAEVSPPAPKPAAP